MIRKIVQRALSKEGQCCIDIIRRSLCTHTYPKRVSEDLNIGQSTPFTHPHLFESELECTPGITHKEYKTRRMNLMKALTTGRSGAARENQRHLVVLTANEIKTMSNDIPFFFHQDVDFLYLTGLNEPNAIVVLEHTTSSNETNFILFVQPKDPKRELWDGAVVGEHAAVDLFQADEAYPLSSFETVLKKRYGGQDCCVWMKKSKDNMMNLKNYGEITKTFQSKDLRSCSLEDVRPHIQKLRAVKSLAEAKLLQDSSTIASKAFKEAIRQTKPGDSESLIHAVFEFNCKTMGAQHLSFPPVVAGGNRANTLHYISNNQLLKENDLVLMDGGCVYHGYASDITRTWPVSGCFTEPQAKLYNVVLNVLKGCYSKCDGSSSLNSLHTVMLDLLGKELQEIGLISPSLSKDSERRQAAANFCPHHLGHYLGMDTHDCPLVYRSIPLKPGMTFTLEPGLYIPRDAVDVPKDFRGIGIRIEDDVIMTEKGPLNLTRELPKEIGDIEKLMQM